MLPVVILDKVFSLLDIKNLLELRLGCREFSCIAKLHLPQVHTLQSVFDPNYLQLLLKKGVTFKGLIIKDVTVLQMFQRRGLLLSDIFPNLCSISFGEVFISEFCDSKALAKDCLSLKNLKHISLNTLPDKLTIVLNNLIQSIDSLYISCLSQSISYFKCFPQLKELSFSTNFLCRKEILFTEQYPYRVSLVRQDFMSVIPSLPCPKNHFVWFEYHGDCAFYLLRIPYSQFIENKDFISEIHPKPLFSDCYYMIKHSEALEALVTIPNLIDQCLVHERTFVEDGNRTSLHLLMGCPSLSIDLIGPIDWEPRTETFLATTLSFKICLNVTCSFFPWIIDCFPYLQHLHIETTLDYDDIPLKANCFPELVYFYSKATQAEFFWFSFIKGSPKPLISTPMPSQTASLRL
ncbi:hypothetical protein DSO57_1016180 [Entomophthora muscae]|uniref:Uncharacterized protein n=1 Tax=Entomophthora muscae TaxID=34485 RepID=A0ACC2TFW7_9FUNG|nr:hypothetical protein DSO57_1016180 [Entomophthora muscae]